MGEHPKDLTLLSKYERDAGPVVLTGVQALVRLPLVRRRLDRKAGLNTAGFISGYRGSPLGTYDMQLAAAKALLDAEHIVVRPAVNEDLGATAVWGSQQVNLFDKARYDGVFGLWYGKAPGVDRTGDAFKHANYAGTWKDGGVLAIAGDDHACKSSTLPSQSEYAFADAEIPVFAPADIAEVLTFGVKAIEVSRFAGLWTAMTVVSDTMDSTATVMVDPADYAVRAPSGLILPPEGLGIRLDDDPHAQEERHRLLRLPAAEAFVRVNGFDRTVFAPRKARFGVIAAGKAFVDVRQALSDLGIDEAEAERIGLRLYKPGLVWPLEPQGALAFARGLETVLVVEERRDLVEAQLKTIAYPLPDAQRPRIMGKQDLSGRPLLKSAGTLDATAVARAILTLIPTDLQSARMRAQLARLDAQAPAAAALHERTPFFCPGCPHNASTKVPDGSRALAGIGCHYMALSMPRNTTSVSQMGGEGVAWMGASPFTDEPHVFVNLGDGTYFHSGILAIRQAVAAKLSITYKILFNDAVAMTGGQHVDGDLDIATLIRQVEAEGVTRIEVVSDDPERTRDHLPKGLKVRPREEMDAVQKTLREHAGVSVIVYDQPCATELRRRRKRGLAAPATSRVFINERVCEDCGDCSAVSNCIAVEPIATPFGQKRRIDQSSCNQDQTCVEGFCPSFVTIEGAAPRKTAKDLDAVLANLPAPRVPAVGARPYNLLLCGVGGHGVTSLAAIIDHAAHIDGAASHSIDMLGLAQKGGAVYVHLRLAANPDALSGARIGAGETDLLLANDMVSAHGAEVAPLASPTRTHAILNTTLSATAQFTLEGVAYDAAGMAARVGQQARSLIALEAGRIVTTLLGDQVFAHMFLLGAGWQAGRVPVSFEALDQAIVLNGTMVAENRKAFALGRLAIADRAALDALLPTVAAEPRGFAALTEQRRADLAAYQSPAYAARFTAAVEKLAKAEAAARPGSTALTEAAAKSLYKLMAYKDEYEVARLYTDGDFAKALKAAFADGGKVSLNLAPPILGKRDPATGRPLKQRFGPWMLRAMPVLAALKGLRGTAFDPFGYTAERKRERALRDEYLTVMDELAARVGKADFDLLLEIARAPMAVRGFGHIKDANADAYEARLAKLREAASRVHPATAGDTKPQRHTLFVASQYGPKAGDTPRLRA